MQFCRRKKLYRILKKFFKKIVSLNVRIGEDTAFRTGQSEQELALGNLTYVCQNEKKK